MNAQPLTAREIMDIALTGAPIPIERLLATFADPNNWVQIYEGKATREGYTARACEWAFIGPYRPPWELAQMALAESLVKKTGDLHTPVKTPAIN